MLYLYPTTIGDDVLDAMTFESKVGAQVVVSRRILAISGLMVVVPELRWGLESAR